MWRAASVGVELNDANDCLVQNNDFRECVTGLNLWRWCKQEDLNKRNAIRGNLFQDTEQNAIQLAHRHGREPDRATSSRGRPQGASSSQANHSACVTQHRQRCQAQAASP